MISYEYKVEHQIVKRQGGVRWIKDKIQIARDWAPETFEGPFSITPRVLTGLDTKCLEPPLFSQYHTWDDSGIVLSVKQDIAVSAKPKKKDS